MQQQSKFLLLVCLYIILIVVCQILLLKIPNIGLENFQKNVTNWVVQTEMPNSTNPSLLTPLGNICVTAIVHDDYDMIGRAIIASNEDGRKWSLDDIRRTSRDQPVPILTRDQYPDFPCDRMHQFPSTSHRVKNKSRQSEKLIYNRVPKCASSTMLVLLTILGERNGFAIQSSSTYWVKVWTKLEEEKFVNSFCHHVSNSSSTEPTSVFEQHFYFVDAERYGVPSEKVPNWINVVRDPVERIVSQFHYTRRPDRWHKDTEQRPPKSWFDKDFSACVTDGDVECQYNPNLGYLVEQQLTYFCGNALECSQVGNAGALNAAKANVERHFSVVGVASDLKMSLRVMEGMLPRFFSGVVDAFQRLSSLSSSEFRVNNARGARRFNVSNVAMEVLRRNLSMEIDFYQFAVQRLMLQDRWLRRKVRTRPLVNQQ